MKTKASYYCIDILIAIVGILLIVFCQQIQLMQYIVMIVGSLFVISSAVNLIGVFLYKNKSGDSPSSEVSFSVTSIFLLAIGALMLIKPLVFVGIASYLLAAMLVIGGVYQLVALLVGTRICKFPLWFFISPIIITIAGLIILMSSVQQIQSAVVLVAGIGFIMFAINDIMERNRRGIIIKVLNDKSRP